MRQQYIISDLHLGHGNIIDYCDRPFDDVSEMNETIVENWNGVVDEDDAVILVGDVCHHPSSLSSIGWLDKLNGNILVVRGNHDGDLPQNAGYNVVESCTIKHGRYEFFVSHGPTDRSGWSIHGHVHNNNIIEFPFVNQETKRVNVSVELIDYHPLKMDHLVSIVDERETFRTIDEVDSWASN